MKTVLKSLIVWVLLLAVPFQGFASATMLVCAPMQSTSSGMASAPHDHRAMLAAQAAGNGHVHDVAPAAASADHGGSTDHPPAAGHSKCNSCAACCIGAAMPPPDATRLPVDAQNFALVPFDSGFVPAVDPAFPERPPKSSLT